ncbi:MAG: hypothetical protein OIF58_08690, partial [Cohaesibacter sp.]|nr:hypothetical protein [Cohaesibacter sp.]
MIEKEARHLLALGDEIIVHRPESAEVLAAWREAVFAFTDNAIQPSIANEFELERLSLELRSIWMQIAYDHTAHRLKSPLIGDKLTLPLGEPVEVEYERVMMPDIIERKCGRYRPTIRGWPVRHLLFRSGMAAISSVLQNIRPYFFGREHPPIVVDFFGGYFETQRAFDLYSSPLMMF